jgi:phosphoglycolate phosphatase-like HAD superfamily hydrolase
MDGLRDTRAIALDFDGVFVDSLEAKRTAYLDVFDRYPAHCATLTRLRDADPAANRVVFLRRAVDEVFGTPGNEALYSELLADLSSAMTRRVSECPEIRGAQRLLAALERWPVYIVSLTPQDDLRAIVHARGLTPRCRDVYGCPPYSKPDALLAIVARERLPSPDTLLVVGDSASDVAAARAIGAPCVLIGGAACDGEVWRVEDLHGLTTWLLGSAEQRSA